MDLQEHDISHELWREYDIVGRPEPYRIEKPVTLYVRPGGSTHRVVDGGGIARCIPFGGTSGTVLRWRNPTGTDPVKF